jgi:hypothetical protein
MSTKKDDILKLLSEGKAIDDIVKVGFNRKYVNEIIRDSKNVNSSNQNNNSENITQTSADRQRINDITSLQKEVDDIKNIIGNNIQGFNIENKIESKKRQIEEIMKILNFISHNEQLLPYMKLNINISITDMGILDNDTVSEKTIQRKPKDNLEKINPIDIYREKGEGALRDILKTYDISALKDTARQYTPDTRGYVYKWSDISKIIDYIVERASNLSEKGSVFVSDSQ